jgi:tol-pal system beta propeller repeat protein TolB
MLVAAGCLSFLPDAPLRARQTQTPPPQRQTTPAQQPTPQPRPTIPPDAVFYQDVSWSPDGKALAYSLLKDGAWNVYVMRADGTQAVKLTNVEGMSCFYTSWSPDGKQLTFGARRGDAKSDIYVINADGTHLKQLTTDPAADSTPAFSPDGRRIAFISDRDGLHQVYVMNADGSAQTRVTRDEARDFNPQWSPDGRRIVYYAEKGDRRDQVWVMNADGSNALLLTGGVGHNIFPAFAPDGQTIIFTSKREGGESAEDSLMFTVKPDGTGLKRLSDQQAFLARFSPDGSRVAFVGGRFPKNAIFVMRADGSDVKRLTP